MQIWPWPWFHRDSAGWQDRQDRKHEQVLCRQFSRSPTFTRTVGRPGGLTTRVRNPTARTLPRRRFSPQFWRLAIDVAETHFRSSSALVRSTATRCAPVACERRVLASRDVFVEIPAFTTGWRRFSQWVTPSHVVRVVQPNLERMFRAANSVSRRSRNRSRLAPTLNSGFSPVQQQSNLTF